MVLFFPQGDTSTDSSSSVLESATVTPTSLSLVRMRAQEVRSRAVLELCSLVAGVLKSPPFPILRLPSGLQVSLDSRKALSPAGILSLLLGVSFALMLCGSLTFMIGFLLMPWVLGLTAVLYALGFVSSVSEWTRMFLAPMASMNPKWRKAVRG